MADKTKAKPANPSPTIVKDHSPTRSEEAKVEDFIKCELCRQILYFPKTLDCLHSFCQVCLTTYITETVGKGSSTANGIVCPICLQMTSPPKSAKSMNDWAQELPSNEFLRSYLEAVSLKDPKRKCDTCRRQQKSEVAQQWCSSCHDALCESCVGFHNALKTTKKHQLVFLSKLRNQPLHSIIVAPHCDLHEGETVTKYCQVHSEVICDRCQVAQHKGCRNFQLLKETAAANKAEYGKTLATLGDETKLSKSIYDDRSKADKTLDDKQAKLLQQITTVRKKINENLSNCESQIIAELYEVHGKEKNEIQTEMKDAQRARKATSKLHSLAESTKEYGNDSHIVINQPEIAKQGEHYKEKLVALNNKLKNTELEFVIDSTLEKLMNGIQNLGQLQVTHSPALLATPQTLRTAKVDSDPEDELEIRRSRRTLNAEEDTKSVKSLKSLRSMRSTQVNIHPSLQNTFSARSATDNEVCWITGVVVMQDGQIIMVDRNNCKLKTINNKFKLLHEMKLKHQPFGITKVSNEQVAVTMPRENRIDIFKVGTILTPSRSISLSDRGYGISYADGKFAVACSCASRPSIKVISSNGEEKKHLSPDDGYHPMFLRPWYVKMDSTGTSMYISDCHTSHVTSISGAVVRQFFYKDESLNSPRGLYVTKDRRVLVCGFGTDNVQLLNSSGQHISDVLSRNNNIMGPQDVALNPEENMMVVTFDPSSGKSDIVHVYRVQM